MKNYERIRQNLKISKHGVNKYQVTVINRRASKVIGKLIPVIPGVPRMLKEIREKFNIPLISPGEDIEEILEPGQDPGHRSCQQGLACPRRSDHDHIIYDKPYAFQSICRLDSQPNPHINLVGRKKVLPAWLAVSACWDLLLETAGQTI